MTDLQTAWDKWNTALADAAAKVEALTEGRDASERAEGYRFLTRITAAMTEFQMEQSADWPSLVQVMSPARKFYVDNPDTLYHRATLDPRLSYRVRGRRGEELYLAFCVYGLRGRSNAILANVCDDEMTIADTFKAGGYRTAAFGKWHNGMQFPYHPNARGFDLFYGFCSGHWGNYFSPLLERNGKLVKGNGFCIDRPGLQPRDRARCTS